MTRGCSRLAGRAGRGRRGRQVRAPCCRRLRCRPSCSSTAARASWSTSTLGRVGAGHELDRGVDLVDLGHRALTRTQRPKTRCSPRRCAGEVSSGQSRLPARRLRPRSRTTSSRTWWRARGKGREEDEAGCWRCCWGCWVGGVGVCPHGGGARRSHERPRGRSA